MMEEVARELGVKYQRCGAIISVKTASAIPKEKMFETMDEIRSFVAPADTKIGDVIISDVAKTGVAIVATSNP